MTSPVEDHRGVDVAQIRALLRMSPAERLSHMLEVSERLRAIAEHARRCPAVSFDPVAICSILTEEQVEYVVVGGLAAVILGSPLPTEDIDVVPSRERDNLERLSRALVRMNAKIRTEGDPVAAPLDAAFLAQMPHILNLVTDFGVLDLTFSPAGPQTDYRQWEEHASSEEIADGLVIRVASLDDLIESTRDKDLWALPYLESLRDVRGP